MNKRTRYAGALLPATISLALLAGLGAETAVRPRPEQAEGYHQKVAALARQSPMRIGDWIGKESQVAPAAVKLLKPNVILNRQFTDVKTGRQVGFLLVHCK